MGNVNLIVGGSHVWTANDFKHTHLSQTDVDRHVVVGCIVPHTPPQIHHTEKKTQTLAVVLQQREDAIHQVIALR